MSRVGKQPIPVPAGVTVSVQGAAVSVKGPKGELSLSLPPRIAAAVENNELVVTRQAEDKTARTMHGTARSLLNNMLLGVSKGFQKELEIQGVGYRAQMQGSKLVLNLGYSHPIEFDAGPGIQVVVPDATKVVISGIDKQRVGEVSARIRGFHKAEPYKGKGVRYKGEKVRRKAGKTVA